MEQVWEGERRVVVLYGLFWGVVAPFNGETERDDLVERKRSVKRSERKGLMEEELIDNRNRSWYVKHSSSAEKVTYMLRHEGPKLGSARDNHRLVKLRRGDSPNGGWDKTEGGKIRRKGVLGKVVEELWGESSNEGGRRAGQRKRAFVELDGELVLGRSGLVVECWM
jgi:hypothetical protein